MVELDRIDLLLLEALKRNARLTVAELGQVVSLTASPCWRRVKRLEEIGVVQGYRASLAPEKLGYGVTAFVNVMMGDHAQDVVRRFEKRIAEIPQIICCHHVSGRYDFQLKVVASDLASFGEFARNVLQALPGVKEIYSSFSLKAVKEDSGPPIPSA